MGKRDPRAAVARLVMLRLTAFAVLIALSGCASSSDPVARAQNAVAAKERALAEAQAHFDSASAALCDTSSDYVEALDRYGDVITDTAPTVGDVRTAGADLSEPREETVDSAEAVGDAHRAVLTAEEELAEARTELEEAMAAATTPAPSAESATPAATEAPLSQQTIDRVKEAEADFDAAQGSITTDTPLADASERFHSAAVELELAWIALLVDAGCLTDEQTVAAHAAVSAYVTALQQDLAEAGYYSGAIDGIYGPDTTAAVEGLQEANGLPVTGTVDEPTSAALQAELAALGVEAAQDELATTAAVQQTLRIFGFWDGPVDGVWTPELTQAVMALQTELGVDATGDVDAATIAAFNQALASAAQPLPSPSASETG